MKFKRCRKCKKKAIYVLDYCKPSVSLCMDHAPKMSNGDPGYRELKVVYKAPLEFNDDYSEYYSLMEQAPQDKCYRCERPIDNIKNFIRQGIKNVSGSTEWNTQACVPVIEFEYWICKKGCIDNEF